MKKIYTFIVENKFAVAYFLMLSIFPLLASSSIVWYVFQAFELLKSLVVVEKLVLFLGLSVCMAFAVVPATIVCFLSGVLWGLDSILFIVPSYLLAQVIGFYIAKMVGAQRLIIYLKSSGKWNNVLETLADQERMVIFLLRISPILPFAITNMVLSSLKVNFRNFMIFGLIGMLPRSVLVLWIGMVSDQFLTTGKIPSLISHPFTMVLFTCSLVGFTYLFYRKKS